MHWIKIFIRNKCQRWRARRKLDGNLPKCPTQRVRLVTGLLFTGARLEAWRRSGQERYSPKQSCEKKNLIKTQFLLLCLYLCSHYLPLCKIPLFLIQPPSNDSLISANFISVPSAKKALPHSFAAFHLANFYSLVKTLNCVFSSQEGLPVHHCCPTAHPKTHATGWLR